MKHILTTKRIDRINETETIEVVNEYYYDGETLYREMYGEMVAFEGRYASAKDAADVILKSGLSGDCTVEFSNF